MSALIIADTVDINAMEPDVTRVERKKRHRKSLHLRRLAQSFDKSSAAHSATSAPITPLALHSEKGAVSPRSPENEVEALPTTTTTTGTLNGSKLLLAVSWPGIGGGGASVGKSIVVSPRSKDMSPRELNRKLTAALVDKNLKSTVTTITRDLADLVNDDDGEYDDIIINVHQQPRQAVDVVRATPDLPLEIPNGLAASRARSALAHRSMPVFVRATVPTAAATTTTTAAAAACDVTLPFDTRKFTFDERVQDDIRRMSSSSTTATTSSSSLDDGSSTTSADKRNTFTLDRSLEGEESSSTAAIIVTDAAVSEGGGGGGGATSSNHNAKSKTMPRRKSERYFADFKRLEMPVITPATVAAAAATTTSSPYSSPRARSSTVLDKAASLVRVNSYSHSMDYSARAAAPNPLKTSRDISRGKTLIQLFVDPAGDKLASYMVPNALIDGKLRNTLTRAATSNVQSLFRSFSCSAGCVKNDGRCGNHLVDPDAAAKYPIINLLDRKSVPVDYRLPHLQAMFQKDFPMLLGDEWSKFKRDGLCTDFSTERISHVYCIRVYC